MKAMRSRCCGIHVRLDLEHEAGELVLVRVDLALRASRAATAPARAREMRQQFLDAEIEIAEPKNTGVWRPLEIGVDVESAVPPRTSSISSSKRAARSPRNSRAFALCRPSMVALRAALAALRRLVDVDAVFEQVIDAGEVATHADRPGDRRAVRS